MFIEVNEHEGVFKTETCLATTYGVTPYSEVSSSYKLNLDHVQEVRFGKVEKGVIDQEIKLLGDHAPWREMLNSQYISFKCVSEEEGESNDFSLIFKKEGMGEYQRIKRIIESQSVQVK